MSTHVYTSTADPENHLYPDSPEFESGIECLGGCNGWQECGEDKHEVPGYKGVNNGPWNSYEDAPWYDEEEFEFHGVLHTWNGNGYGWTVPFPGCVVAANDYTEPYGADVRREGSWLVEDDWDDTTVSLNVIVEVEDDRTTPVAPTEVEGSTKYSESPTAGSVASYYQAAGVPHEYASEFAKNSRRIGTISSTIISSESVLIASNAGVPAEYAYAADAYASMFAVGAARGAIIVELHKAGVPIEYIQAGMGFWVAPSVLIGASAGHVPLDYLEQLSEAPVAS